MHTVAPRSRTAWFQAHAAPGPQGAVAATEAARGWIAVAAADDPGDESAWNLLAEYDGLLSHLGPADLEFRRALALNPWSTDAMNGLGEIAARHGDKQQAGY